MQNITKANATILTSSLLHLSCYVCEISIKYLTIVLTVKLLVMSCLCFVSLEKVITFLPFSILCLQAVAFPIKKCLEK